MLATTYGGLFARLFACAHPDQVAGVVLVDAMGRDATRRQLAIWPRSQASAQRREWAKPVQDGVDVDGGEALAGSIRTSGDTPVVVITGARTWTASDGDAPPRLAHALDRLWRRLHAELARLSRPPSRRRAARDRQEDAAPSFASDGRDATRALRPRLWRA